MDLPKQRTFIKGGAGSLAPLEDIGKSMSSLHDNNLELMRTAVFTLQFVRGNWMLKDQQSAVTDRCLP